MADLPMTDAPMTDDSARALRSHWFQYLDTIEPWRAPLHDAERSRRRC